MIAPPRPPSRDELEALIKEARARQLRRRLLGAAGVAIAAAAGLSVYAFSIGVSNHTKPADGSANSPLPLCRSAQLTASTWFNGAAGSLLGDVMISHAGPSRCSLPTVRPRVLLAPRSKQRVLVEPLSENGAPRLRRGAIADVSIQWSNWCGEPPRALTLRFSDALQVTAPLTDARPPCGDPSFPSRIAIGRPLTPP